MDLHPTPFPGKRRPSTTSTKKDSTIAKPSKKSAPPALAPTQSRPKRAFGVPRSTNIPIEKPPPTKTSKPWKPSGTSADPGKKNAEKALDNVSGGRSGKSKEETKKNLRVVFQEPVAAAATGSIEPSKEEDGVRTPISSNKRNVSGTPYLSAQNCSKCRLDKMETSTYWIQQIKLAESVGKHFVASVFFRLALECDAQPLVSLKRELKHYLARHGSISTDSSWGELCQTYGLSHGPSNTDPEEETCETAKGETLESDVTHSPHKDLLAEELIDVNSSPKEEHGTKESGEAKLVPPPSEEFLCKHNTSSAMAIRHVKKKKPCSSSVSGKKSNMEKSKRAPVLSSNVPSSKANKSLSWSGSGGQVGEASGRSQPGSSKKSVGKLAKGNEDDARNSPTDDPGTKEEDDGTIPICHLGENGNNGEPGEDAATY